jgi:hypothetical protein
MPIVADERQSLWVRYRREAVAVEDSDDVS